ncbi:MAG TPA: prephenate dehydrogenase [Clostridiales bacterium]|nr:prephenate dehydrogenase [Clostridiales bacterium]
MVKNIGFIGFGLIGGSIARALKNINKDNYLITYQYNNSDIKPELSEAINDGSLDKVVFKLDDGFQECDIIFLCAPVLSNIEYLSRLKPLIKPSCILTDVGSVKANIHKAVIDLGLEDQYVGGHPMTGSEKTGYSNSYALLLENAYYIITYTDNTPDQMVRTLAQLVEAMGSIAILLTPYEHDEITAAISHLPHIIASQLVNLVRNSDDEDSHMKQLAAGGFRDITRIASSSPSIWQNICLTNSNSIKKLLDDFINSLINVSIALKDLNEEYLYEMFDEASEYRNSIPKKSIGMIKKLYEIYIDITDETGAIAIVATLLAANNISIKNIGIVHNREFFEGVLRIDFYDSNSVDKAYELLRDNNYKVYER